jgi:hypothetical protein
LWAVDGLCVFFNHLYIYIYAFISILGGGLLFDEACPCSATTTCGYFGTRTIVYDPCLCLIICMVHPNAITNENMTIYIYLCNIYIVYIYIYIDR